MWPDHPDWQMTALFLFAVTVMTVVLKLIALRVTNRPEAKCPRAFWIIPSPLYIVTGRTLFGTMMIYFSLQAAGILIERRFKERRGWTTIWCGLVVFLPGPLIINEGLLRTMHLW